MKKNRVYSVIRVLFIVLFGTLLMGQFERFQLTRSISLYAHEGILFLLFLIVFLHTQRKNRMSMPRIFRIFLAFAILSLFSVGLRILTDGVTMSILIGFLYVIRLLLYGSFFLVVQYALKSGIITRKYIKNGLIALGAGFAISGLIQYFFLPDTRFLFFLGWDDHYYRIISTLFDPPFTAAMIMISLLLLHDKKNWNRKMIFLWIVMASSFLLTYSRAGFISYSFGLFVLFLRTKDVKTLVAISIVFLSLFFLPRPASEGARLERTQSIVARKNSIQKVLQSFDMKTWMIGNGWYVETDDKTADIPFQKLLPSHSSSVDNSFLQVIRGVGILGFGFFVYILLQILRKIYVSPVLFSIFLALGTASLFNNVLFYPWIMLSIWSLLCLFSWE